jgi:hypothetical protein
VETKRTHGTTVNVTHGFGSKAKPKVCQHKILILRDLPEHLVSSTNAINVMTEEKMSEIREGHKVPAT